MEVCAFVMGRMKRACHLHPILCAWDAIITCIPVTIFFPLGVRLCSKKQKNKTKKNKKQKPRALLDFTSLDQKPVIKFVWPNVQVEPLQIFPLQRMSSRLYGIINLHVLCRK